MSKKAPKKPASFAKLVEDLVVALHHVDYRQFDVMVDIQISRGRGGNVTGFTKRIIKTDKLPDKCPAMEVNRVYLYFASKGKKHILKFPEYSKEVWDFLMGEDSASLSVKEIDLKEVKHQDFRWLNNVVNEDSRLEENGRVREFNLDFYDLGEEKEEESLTCGVNLDRAFGLGELLKEG